MKIVQCRTNPITPHTANNGRPSKLKLPWLPEKRMNAAMISEIIIPIRLFDSVILNAFFYVLSRSNHFDLSWGVKLSITSIASSIESAKMSSSDVDWGRKPS